MLLLLQERFPHFESALRADAAVSDALISTDRMLSVNVVDGAASTLVPNVLAFGS